MTEDKIPRVVDVNGYVLNEEEVRLEWDLYKKAGISFLCPHCRRTVGAGDYKEFVRRRNMLKPVSHHFKSNRRVITDQQTKDWEKSIREVLVSCPFCGERDLQVDIQFERPFDYISCPSCIAKWQIRWKGEDCKIESLTLTKDSVDKRGKDFLNRTLRPEFWKDFSTNPMKNVTAEGAIKEEHDFSKVRTRALKEKHERIKAQKIETLATSLVVLSLGLATLGIGYWVTAADRFSMIIFLFFGGILLLAGAFGTISSTRALWYLSPERSFNRMVKRHRKAMDELLKQNERFDQLTLVECPKCHNRYDRS